MHRLILALAVTVGGLATAVETSQDTELLTWRVERERTLRADNGWLTLAGRYALKPGANTFGTGKDNDVVFPPELEGVGPARLGTLHVDADAKQVTLRLADGVEFTAGDKPFTGERALGTDKPDRVGLGRFRMHVIVRDGKFVLRLADNESAVRKNFPGCVWYPADARFKVDATFVPYPAGRTMRVVNVLDQVSEEPSPGYAEFKLNGQSHKLDAIAEGGGLFFVFKDQTAGDTTYPPARFLSVEKRPKDHGIFTLDFNRAYNPPCAVSDFTTCPTAPPQNVLPVRIEAGEKYVPRSARMPEEAAHEVARVAALMTGSFSSEEQSKVDAAFFDVRLHMARIWADKPEEQWLYVEQAMATALDEPYRQRVYQLVWKDGAVVSRVYTLPGDPLTFAGAWEKPERLAGLTPDKLAEKAGCAINLTRTEDDKYTGSTTGKGCASELRGASYTTSEVTLTEHGLTSWDRGFDTDGKQVWGAVKGPYQFKKLPAANK